MTEVLKVLFWVILGIAFGIMVGMSYPLADDKPSYLQPLQLPKVQILPENKTKSYYQYDQQGNTKWTTVTPLIGNQKSYQTYDFKTKTWEYGIIENE